MVPQPDGPLSPRLLTGAKAVRNTEDDAPIVSRAVSDHSQDVAHVGPIIISGPRRYVGDIDAVIDAPHLDMMKRGWPVY
jgi:hypothetical protein